MSVLNVYLNSQRVGVLEQDSAGMLSFTYADEWLKHDVAIPVSRMLPLSSETYGNKHSRPFFAGVLPEEGPRAIIARILGISEGNDFAMLERIGGECAGAVSVLPAGVEPAPLERLVRVLDKNELTAIVEELPRRPLMAGTEGVRLSLAGAQDKLPIVLDGNKIALPLGNTPSTHIIKPEPERFSGLVNNEAFCMALARSVGMSVPETEMRLIGGKPSIIVTRYDRKPGLDGIIRLHQEDFCQALGCPPERKYQQEGGPTVRGCIGLLREWSSAPVLDIAAFVDALSFNILIGNADAHSKNYSILYADGARRLAPLYDLVCNLVWPDLSKRLAMNIGHARSVNDLNPAHFKKMAEECELGWPMVRERIQNLVRKVSAAVDDLNFTPLSADGMTERIRDQIQQRCRKLQG